MIIRFHTDFVCSLLSRVKKNYNSIIYFFSDPLQMDSIISQDLVSKYNKSSMSGAQYRRIMFL